MKNECGFIIFYLWSPQWLYCILRLLHIDDPDRLTIFLKEGTDSSCWRDKKLYNKVCSGGSASSPHSPSPPLWTKSEPPQKAPLFRIKICPHVLHIYSINVKFLFFPLRNPSPQIGKFPKIKNWKSRHKLPFESK